MPLLDLRIESNYLEISCFIIDYTEKRSNARRGPGLAAIAYFGDED
jgi:hypothetical protein